MATRTGLQLPFITGVVQHEIHKNRRAGNPAVAGRCMRFLPRLNTQTRHGLAIALAVATLISSIAAHAASTPHLGITQPGGMPGSPVITGVERITNGMTVTWDGPPGYYQLFQKHTFKDNKWVAVGGRTNTSRRATITTASSNAFFRVSGPSPQYAGARACIECHPAAHKKATNTMHALAFVSLKQIGQEKNPDCLPCHTVGHKLATGFVSEAATPHLAGVQCESCHGPAAAHAANPDDLVAKPRVEVASTVCGGCHDGSKHATFQEWAGSGHGSVFRLDLNSTNRISSCGRCHSGTARVNLIRGKALPSGDANMPIGCVTCHDPHQKTANPSQLRNPLRSTNNFVLTSSDDFSSAYNTNINICAQCHNDAGASWMNSGSPPHRSPQYNMLLGTVGVKPSGLVTNEPAEHGLSIVNQCVACHMGATGTEGATINHSMRVQSYESCRECHPLPEQLTDFTKLAMAYQIENVKAWLDYWASTEAPAPLRTAYGSRAWEYTRPGELSPGGAGPTAAEQAQIPANIQKARFNLYLVLRDGSYGVHNPPLTIELLDAARIWVQEELEK